MKYCKYLYESLQTCLYRLRSPHNAWGKLSTIKQEFKRLVGPAQFYKELATLNMWVAVARQKRLSSPSKQKKITKDDIQDLMYQLKRLTVQLKQLAP